MLTLRPRKTPRQARSRQMREDILQAAVRVLQREGALKFTTPRVAEVAGISVGSLYQYFPNKHALVFAVHQRTVEQSWVDVQRVLESKLTPGKKLQRLARLYFLAESGERGQMGPALRDAEVFFRDQPEQRKIETLALRRLEQFLREHGTREPRFGARLLFTVLESTGKAVSGARHHQVVRVADACAAMLTQHLFSASSPGGRSDRDLRGR